MRKSPIQQRNASKIPCPVNIIWDNSLIRCPNGISLPFHEGGIVHFPEHECLTCPLRTQCTKSKHGRTISIHPDESLLFELRERQTSFAGRAPLRQPISVEHSLAHIGYWQGDQARYLGLRKNLFDLRRMAVVHNLHVLARMSHITPENSSLIPVS
ncbi:putative transposase [Nostoc carneum NIES-2107]|nr:putative transposase [Nostoc carneum NIES-2107]